jgi:hypothetical protein
VLLSLLVGWAPAARADDVAQAGGVSLSIRAGFDAYYKEAHWVPVRISVANDGPDVTGTLSIVAPRNDGSLVTYARAVELPTQSRRELYMYIPTEGFVSKLEVTLADETQKLAPTASVRLTQAGPTDLIYGVLAGSPSAYNSLGDVDPVNGSAYVAQLELGDLPPLGQGWLGLDVLVLSDVDTGAFTPEQRAALSGWITGGGHLIVAGGPGWQKTIAGVSNLLPLLPSKTQTLPTLSALAAFAAATDPASSAVAAVGSLAPEAIVLAENPGADGPPLVVTRRQGLGQVTFLAVDPSFAPLRGWDGFAGLFRNTLSVSTTSDRPSWADGLRNWYTARDAVNALPGLDLPSTWQICGFLGLYIAVIGPVNYLVLKRLRRRELAWVTIPALVVVFSGATYLTGYQLRGSQATLHRLAIVQVWPDSEWARVDQLVGVFSPRRADYDLEFAEQFLARPMPSEGSYGNTPGLLVMEQGETTRVSDVRVDIGAVQSFVAQGQIAAPRFEAALTLDVGSQAQALTGLVTNQSDLTLINAALLAPGAGNVVRLGDLSPGQTQNISLSLYNSRASQAPYNAIAPAFSTTAGNLVAQPYYSSGYDTTIDDILGTTNYYQNKDDYRRFSLLSAAIDPYNGGGRGNGVYLVGWTSDSPVGSEVVGRSFSTLNTTLYIVALSPELDLGQGLITLPPVLMNWMVLDPGLAGSPTPYDMYIYQNSDYALRFTPAVLLPFQEVADLTLHLTSYGVTGPTGLLVYLWDFAESAWVEQPAVEWGDTRIPAAGRFVGPAGEIHVRVSNSNALQLSIERLDFTLAVER